MPDHLIAPHGGVLVDLLAGAERQRDLKAHSREWPSWDLTPRQLCDIELLLSGGFSPLDGFLRRKDYERVITDMRLAGGALWPIPITLDIPEELAGRVAQGGMLALRDAEGVMLAALHVEDVWRPDREAEAQAVFGTTSREHPGVAHLLDRSHPVYVGGRVEGLEPPHHYDFQALRHTPAEVRAEFARRGWRTIVAFQTRNPMHRAHQELTLRAAHDVQANLLIHPVVGMTKPGDVDHYTRVRCYQALLPSYPPNSAMLSLLPLAMRMGGPREAVWHAIIRRNYGCTHFIVGRDHAGPGKDGSGKPVYGPYDAQQLLERHQAELGVHMVPFKQMLYVPELDSYFPEDAVPAGAKTMDLSGSGKSTIANVLLVKLLEMGGRSVTLLDGDVVRKHLSSELGFSKEHRDINIRRIGYVASEITKNGGIAICAPIAPYDRTRKDVRALVEGLGGGGFILVHVATPLEVGEGRDRKGLYAKARAGLVKEFTGVSDPYEAPSDAELVIDTTEITPAEAAQQILLYLETEGFIG